MYAVPYVGTLANIQNVYHMCGKYQQILDIVLASNQVYVRAQDENQPLFQWLCVPCLFDVFENGKNAKY